MQEKIVLIFKSKIFQKKKKKNQIRVTKPATRLTLNPTVFRKQYRLRIERRPRIKRSNKSLFKEHETFMNEILNDQKKNKYMKHLENILAVRIHHF